MRIASWNINGIGARLDHVLSWLAASRPDVALLQELKCVETVFPLAAIHAAGYKAAFLGQKGYNGVAILAREEIQDVAPGLPVRARSEPEEGVAARYIEGSVGNVRVASVYVPNGMEVGCSKYGYKMAFYEDLRHHIRIHSGKPHSFVIGGDFNVAHLPADVHDPLTARGRLLYSLPERQAFRRLLHDGLTDTYRALHPAGRDYSWWDYRAGRFEANQGWRIDYVLANAAAAQTVKEAGTEPGWRGLDRPSDHVPVWCLLA